MISHRRSVALFLKEDLGAPGPHRIPHQPLSRASGGDISVAGIAHTYVSGPASEDQAIPGGLEPPHHLVDVRLSAPDRPLVHPLVPHWRRVSPSHHSWETQPRWCDGDAWYRLRLPTRSGESRNDPCADRWVGGAASAESSPWITPARLFACLAAWRSADTANGNGGLKPTQLSPCLLGGRASVHSRAVHWLCNSSAARLNAGASRHREKPSAILNIDEHQGPRSGASTAGPRTHPARSGNLGQRRSRVSSRSSHQETEG